MARAKQAVLAVDIGGTKTIIAAVRQDGSILSCKHYPSGADKGARAVTKRLSSAITTCIAEAKSMNVQLIGLGIGFAGVVDTGRGIVTTSPNLPGWRNVRLRDAMAGVSGLMTHLINDASAAALGEQRFGAGRGVADMLYVTISTGIGGGIIIDGDLYSGADGCAGEWGHMTIMPDGPKCHCGNFGCLEALASGWAIARDAVTHINSGDSSSITRIVNGKMEDITAETVAAAARQGDRLASEIVNKAAIYFGIGLANLINIFNPERIVIGGGLSKMGGMLLKPAKQVIKERAFRLPIKTVRLVRARLGSNAGIVGAAAYVFEHRSEEG